MCFVSHLGVADSNKHEAEIPHLQVSFLSAVMFQLKATIECKYM